MGRRLDVARSTIEDNLKRAAAAGLAWPLADDVTDDALERQLLGRAAVTQGQRRRAEPDWSALARELKRPGVTMTILWEEYRETHSEGYGYSRFCDLLRGFEQRLTPVMRKHHVVGEKASTITSRSMTFSIRSRTRRSAPKSTCALPRAWSRSSIAANASASISAAPWAASTARTPTICRAPTCATPSGRRIGSAAKPGRLGQTPKA